MEDVITPTNSSSDSEELECHTPRIGTSPTHTHHPHKTPSCHTPTPAQRINGYPQVKILSQSPPAHPQAARNHQNGNHSPPGRHRHYSHHGRASTGDLPSNSVSHTPVMVESVTPSRNRSLSNVSSSSTYSIDDADLEEGGSKRSVRVRFEVTVRDGGVADGEDVRVTGNSASLGKWNVLSSIKLHRNIDCDRWSVELDVPTEIPIKYRYMVTQDVNASSVDGALRIKSWETFLNPRTTTFRKPKSSSDSVPRVLRGEFGVDDSGQTHTDAGWLVSTSELHLQLGTLGSAISIDGHSEDTHYLLRVEAFSTKAGNTVECSPFEAKLQNRTSGDCATFDLESGACPYDQQTNVVVFTTESHDFQNTGFSIDVYTCEKSATPTLPVSLPPSSCKVGRASLLPRQYIGDESQGGVVLTLFSPELFPIGTLSLSFLLIHPTRDIPLVHSTKHSYSNYWKKHKRMLHIGHRGLGDSYHAELKPTVTENTISSLKMAGNHGADYVEFDVQLTKDRVPIVYHNFQVCTTLAREGYFSGELYAMQVKELTLQQLQSLKLDHSSVMETISNTSESPSNSSSEYGSSNETYWGPNKGAAYKGSLPEKKTFPTLANLFKSLPTHIGFDIEVKFPVPERDKAGVVREDYPSFDCNFFADAILKVVYRHARGRKIMFTCFNPDMCTVLRRKQPKYPVLFLTVGHCPVYDDPLDVRGGSVHEAIMHVKSEKLLGVVPNSYHLLRDHGLIKAVKEKDLVLFTWGHENNDLTNIEAQKKAGVDAVIYDCIHNLLKPQKNIFQLEAEERAVRRRKLSDQNSCG